MENGLVSLHISGVEGTVLVKSGQDRLCIFREEEIRMETNRLSFLVSAVRSVRHPGLSTYILLSAQASFKEFLVL